jgi:tRNA(fMet)-specific endonuclease VapC
MILFDTDAFIELMRGNTSVVDYVREVGINSIYINPVIKSEIQFKAINKRDLVVVNSRLEAYPVIPLYDDISHKFSDMLVAAIAVSYDISLFTLNAPHFNFIRELKLVKHSIKPLPRTKGSWFE